MKTKMMNLISSEIKPFIFNQLGNFMGAEGGGEPGGEGGEPPAGGGEPGPQISYPEGFDETLKDNPTLMKYFDKEKNSFDYGKIMKAHVHATSMLGKDKVTLPDETWTEDQWKDLYHKLGKPEGLESYDIKGNLPEGMQENKEFKKMFKEMAFNSNLLPKQAESIYNALNEYIHGTISQANEQNEAQYNSEVNKLKTDWGEAYEQKCVRAYSALEEFASKEEIEALKSEGFIQSPVVTRLFDKVAESLQGDNFKIEGKGTFGMTPSEAEEEIAKMYSPEHPFMIKGHPQRAYYQEKMQKLQRVKLAGRKVK